MISRREKGTVLIIDDDEMFLEELIYALYENGYDSVTVSDPLIAADEVARVKPRVVFLDIKMPEKGGWQVAHEIKRNPASSYVPILAISGCFPDDSMPPLHLFGIRKCLSKSIPIPDLIREIENVSLAGQAGE